MWRIFFLTAFNRSIETIQLNSWLSTSISLLAEFAVMIADAVYNIIIPISADLVGFIYTIVLALFLHYNSKTSKRGLWWFEYLLAQELQSVSLRMTIIFKIYSFIFFMKKLFKKKG